MAPSPGRESVGRWIVSRLGGDPAEALGLDLDREADLGRWWVAALLRSGRGGEAAGEAAFRALAARDLDTPERLAGAGPEEVAGILEEAALGQAERSTQVLLRACRNLVERYGASLARLAAEAEGIEDLGGRLAALGRGVGASTIHGFLRPLRRRWPAAADLPLSPAASAAADHLDLAWDGDPDVEAALERLGRKSCLRGRVERCPLADQCPVRRARPG